MKKTKRLFALCLSLVLLCLCTTGCNAIDEMRKNQAFYNADGSISLDNTDYLLLPENELFSPYNSDDTRMIEITEADVPVLLSTVWGTTGTLYNDGEILLVDYGKTCYCRKDKYVQYAALLTAPFEPTGYCYTYYELDVEDTFEYIEHNYYLTPDQAKAVDEILATVTPSVRDENATYHSDYSQALYACDDTMLLREETVSIEKTGDNYYLVEYNVDSDREYEVPTEYHAIFEGIIKQAFNAEKAEEAYYGELYGYEEDEYYLDYEVA